MRDSLRVLVIAGGEWQIPLVRKVKELGFTALCSSLYPDSPAFKFADATFLADVRDRQANLNYAREQKVDAVLSDQSDMAVPTVAYICEQLGLPGIGLAAAEMFTNKAMMRAFCAEHGFPSPKYRLCRAEEDAILYAREIGFPCVVKPPNNQASRGVAKVSSKSEMAEAFANAMKNTQTGAVLVEQFIGGTELTIEGFKHARGHASLAVSRKWHYAHNPMVAKRLLYSPDDDEIDYARLRRQHDRMIEGMGLPFGITHAEYKYDKGEFYLVEVAARGGGTRIASDIVPLLSGVDVMMLLIRTALGEKIELDPQQLGTRCAALDFWDFDPGLVREIKGLEEVRATPGVIAAGVNLRPGQSVRAAQDDSLRHGYVIAYADNKPALERLLHDLRSKMKIVYDEKLAASPA